MQVSRLLPTAPLVLGENYKLEMKILALYRAIAGETALLKPDRQFVAGSPRNDWLVFQGAECSLAVWLPHIAEATSRMSAALGRLRVIQQVQGAIDRGEWPHCELLNVGVIAEEWLFFRFGRRKQATWLALLGALPDELPIVECRPVDCSSAPRGRFGIRVTIPISKSVMLGEEFWLSREISVLCRGLRCTGNVKVNEDGGICMEVVELNSARVTVVDEVVDTIAMHVEIGAIELGADDFFALRVGSLIELSRPEIMTCNLRIGEATFAIGELSIREKEMVLRVIEILDVA